MNKLKLGSLFDGIGGFPLSAQRHGIEPVWASEIEPFPIKVTQHHFPNMKHLGDITQINGAEIEPVDIITFGSPCTRLSVAGKHDGFNINFECQGNKDSPHEIYSKTIRATDKYQYEYTTTCPVCGQVLFETNESALFFHAIRVIREMRDATDGTYPRFAVWENVPGAFSSNKGEDFRAVLSEITEAEIPMPRSGKWANAGMVRTERIDIAWRTLDAQYWGVPQRRRRIFLVADFTGQCAAEILFKPEGLRGNIAESGETREGIATNAERSVDETSDCLTPWDVQSRKVYKASGKWSALYGGEGGGRGYVAIPETPKTMLTRCGKEGGGEGALVSKEKSLTLGCSNDQALIAIFAQNQRDEVRGLGDKTGALQAEPGMKQQTFVIQNATRGKSQNGLGISQDDVSYTLDSLGNHAVCIQGTMIGRADKNGPQGDGINEDVSFTLNTTDRHAVAYNAVATMDCRNLCENEELSGTIQAKENGGYSLNYQNPVRVGYAVRRLTPLECERLMGFPDGWTDIPGASDTARYKSLGNSVAIPCVDFVMSRIAEVLRTK